MKSAAELEEAVAYAERLGQAAMDTVGTAQVQLDQSWARNPKVVALTILCRSISNFRAVLLLGQQEQVLEARALVRLMYENLLWLGALRERGPAFVEDMREDEAFNRRTLGELTLRISGKYGGDVTSADALKLRSLINELDQEFQKPKTIDAGKTAAAGVVEIAYVPYKQLSLDAVHCSVTALGRHLSQGVTEGTLELVLSVVPSTPPAEVLSTVRHACRALIGTAVGANELVGFTTVSPTLKGLIEEFEKKGWQN